MNIVIFGGPSIPAEDARSIVPGASFRGPAACGDVCRACIEGADFIGIIDGYFDHRLSVWHKEILWALSGGARVYGAASMGALRAAELDIYGMVGVGAIYEMFKSGELEDDDEVAVLHEPAERGYATCSDAMVNIRATLRAALSAAVIDSEEEAAFIAAAKALHYPERSFDALAAGTGAAMGFQPSRLREWFGVNGLVDQKLADALAMLRRISEDARGGALGHHQSMPRVAYTQYWHILKESVERETLLVRGRESRDSLAQHDPLVRTAAAERALAIALATIARAEVSSDEMQRASEQFRREHSLLTPEATAKWLTQNSLDLTGFSKLAHDQVLIRRFGAAAHQAALDHVPSVLRELGLHSRSS